MSIEVFQSGGTRSAAFPVRAPWSLPSWSVFELVSEVCEVLAGGIFLYLLWAELEGPLGEQASLSLVAA